MSEAEVIAEFLRNEYHEEEFDRDRTKFEHFVKNPDVSNEAENALRRSLLFRRRQHVWRELPPDTQWWEVQIEHDDLNRLKIFPRGRMARLAAENLYLEEFAKHIRVRGFPPFLIEDVRKIKSLTQDLQVQPRSSFVLLIAPDDYRAMSILDGNHRLAAGILVSPDIVLRQFRYYYGCSPSVTKCVWYENNAANLLRYLKTRVQNIFYKEPDFEHLPSH